MRVLKQTLEMNLGEIQSLSLDRNTWILRADFQKQSDGQMALCLWYTEDTEDNDDKGPADFVVVATGQELPYPPYGRWEPLDTVMTPEGLVFHVFVCASNEDDEEWTEETQNAEAPTRPARALN